MCFANESIIPAFFYILTMNKIITIVIILLSATSYAQNANWTWAKRIGWWSKETIDEPTMDANGNIYIAGTFKDATIIGNDTLTSAGDNDIFIAKLNGNGNIIWAKKFGTAGSEITHSIKSGKNGNIYIAGSYNGYTIIGNDTLQNPEDQNGFLMKLNNNGDIQWAKDIKCKGDNKFNEIAVDSLENIYVTGYFSDSATIGNQKLYTPAGWKDILLIKYDPTGNVIWAKQAGSQLAYAEEEGWGISTDGKHIYATGFINYTSYFDANYITHTAGNTNVFIAKYDVAGNNKWVKMAGNSSQRFYENIGFNVVSDNAGNIYLSGHFVDTAYFGSLTISTTIENNQNFLAKYDSTGLPVWVINTGGIIYGNEMILDDSANIYIENSGSNGHYISKYNAQGVQKWTIKPDKAAINKYTSLGLCRGSSGDIFLTGNFSDTLVFGTSQLISSGQDVFIAKIPSNPVSVYKIGSGEKEEKDILVSPNPANTELAIDTKGEDYVSIRLYDQLGRVVLIHNILAKDKVQRINIGDLANGIYYLHVYGTANTEPKIKKVLIMK